MIIRPYAENDLPAMRALWNAVVVDGQAFPQIKLLDKAGAREFFASQTRSAVAVDAGDVVGLSILHPNNVGRCAHIANASFAVDQARRGQGIGRALVCDALDHLTALGFRGLQFNAVVKSNEMAIRLYESLGFERIGVIPGGFRTIDDVYEDIIIFYHGAPEGLGASESDPPFASKV